jgi:CRISPR-associated protein Cas1
MIKRTIEVSTGPTHLAIKDGQLIISREREVVGTVPCEDIGVVVIDHPAVTYTHGVLTTLTAAGAVMIACGPDHHPCGYVWPVEGNGLHTERLRLQVEGSRPLGKRIWQQIVRAKVNAQAAVLEEGSPALRKLINLCGEVRSGDPSNIEAQAAKVYWRALFPSSPLAKGAEGDQGGSPKGGAFRRDPDGPPPNNLLNYGYMALRAATARAICAAGLHPSIGFHHRNRYNPFCLADDLVEPMRPFVDVRVRALWNAGKKEIDRDSKTSLLGVLSDTARFGAETGPLLVCLSRMMGSLVRVLEGKEKRLEMPAPCS